MCVWQAFTVYVKCICHRSKRRVKKCNKCYTLVRQSVFCPYEMSNTCKKIWNKKIAKKWLSMGPPILSPENSLTKMTQNGLKWTFKSVTFGRSDSAHFVRVQTRASLTVCKQDEVFPAPIEWRIQQNYRQKRTHSDRVTFWASCRSQKEEEYAIQFIHIFINKNYFLTINECFFSSCSSAFTIFITTHCLLLETSECWWWWKYKLILSTAV